MYNVYLTIPVIMFKIQMKFDVRNAFIATVLSVLFNIIGHAAIYVDFTALCGVGMWAIKKLGLVRSLGVVWIDGYLTFSAGFMFKQILLVALAVFSVYEIINTVITAASRK